MTEGNEKFRQWLTFCISCAGTVPDALDPTAAGILRNVRDTFDKLCGPSAALHPTDQQPKVMVPMYGTSAERGAAPDKPPATALTAKSGETPQKTDVLDAALAAQVRNAALEEAARVADDHGRTWGLAYRSTTDVIAAAIRGLVKEVG